MWHLLLCLSCCRSSWSIKMRWMIISLLSCWLDSSFLYTPPPQFPTLLPKRIFLFWIVETFFSWVLLNQGKIHKRVQSPFKEWKSVQSSCILSYLTHFDRIQKHEENFGFLARKFKYRPRPLRRTFSFIFGNVCRNTKSDLCQTHFPHFSPKYFLLQNNLSETWHGKVL